MDKQTWEQFLEARGAFWFHDGNPLRPHATLTSGNHSNGFFDGSKVIADPVLLKKICQELLQELALPNMFGKKFSVIGSAHGASDISYEIGCQLGCNRGFTEPIKGTMQLKRFRVAKDEQVLVVEDVITTGKSTRETIASLEMAGAKVMDQIVVIVNRSGMTELDGRKIVALIDRPMEIWTAGECPLCKLGSEAVRPKNHNWDKLTADY